MLSTKWESSPECLAEYRTAENLGKQILCARLQDGTGRHTSEWQHTDLFADGLPAEDVETIPVRGGPPVVFATAGLNPAARGDPRSRDRGGQLRVAPTGATRPGALSRAGSRSKNSTPGCFSAATPRSCAHWTCCAAMRTTGVDSLFVVLGPSGSGKSSFLRAGLLPRLRREDQPLCAAGHHAPERHALTGDSGLAHAISAGRRRLGLDSRRWATSKSPARTDPAAVRRLLAECRTPPHRGCSMRRPDAATAPTLVLPLDQAEELFTADAGPEAAAFLKLIADLASARCRSGSDWG